jgi:hypothetical protein
MAAKKQPPQKAAKKEAPAQAALSGTPATLAPLASVRPNDWNPNEMTNFEKRSVAEGFRRDGWVQSQALLIWRTDENGREQNVIIDGEHRWDIAKNKLKMTHGPMVYMDGITRAEAKALTIKLDAKRGRFNPEKLGFVVRDIAPELRLPEEELALSLGIEQDRLAGYLLPEGEEQTGVIGELPSGQTAQVRMVQLFFKPEDHEAFSKLVKDLAVRFKTNNVTDTIGEAVRRAHKASAP